MTDTLSREQIEFVKREGGYFRSDSDFVSLYNADELRHTLCDMALRSLDGKAVRTLFATDSWCPACGHNRDRSSVSTIAGGQGMHHCQMCDTPWLELDLSKINAATQGRSCGPESYDDSTIKARSHSPASAAPVQPQDGVVVPRETFESALHYIRHCGANQVARGAPHPQQWLVDALFAARPKE